MAGSMNLAAQEKLSYIEVDTSTYQQYLRGEWKTLIHSGKDALDQGINYYYLQMRIAYAYFMRQQYRTAIKYYRNALEFNSKDHVANEYLYYCYLFSGRLNDALIQTKSLTDVQKKAMNISDSVSIVSLGLKYSYAFSDASTIHGAIISDLIVLENGIQKTTNSFHLPKLELSHRLGKHVIANHSLSYLQKNEFSYAINNAVYISPEQLLNQLEYGISLEIAPSKGWLIRPGFNYISLQVPLYEISNYGVNAGRDRMVFDYLSIKNRVFSILVRREFSHFSIGLSAANNNFNRFSTTQAGIHLSVYPLSNLNLYFTSEYYYQLTRYNTQTEVNHIYNQVLGFKLQKNLWLELSASIPENMNLYDIRNDISYNNIEKITYSWNATAIVPLYKPKLKIFAGFGSSVNSSYFFPDSDYLNPLNNHTYNNYIVTGGIRWTR